MILTKPFQEIYTIPSATTTTVKEFLSQVLAQAVINQFDGEDDFVNKSNVAAQNIGAGIKG